MKELKERKEKIISLYDKGLSLNAIGELLGISRQRVWQIIHNKKHITHYEKDPYYIEEVLKRDNYKCVLCSDDKNCIVHHIDGNTLNNTFKNRITLCRSCHTKIHNKEKFNFDTDIYEKYSDIVDNSNCG